ncbi:class I SAM-dependent methyltransferase [bacterium]|nr:class I SAM-dependent methyltransferase [bacterium]MCK4597632.1 class I SAM-dependent methyltransferase [bacterium]
MSKKTTFSTGFEKSKLYAYFSLIKYFRKNREFALHDYHDVFLKAKNVLEQYVTKQIQSVRILEIGCGQRFAITLLFHSLGAHIIGIDTDFVEPNFSFKGFLSVWKKNGFERFAKTLFRHILLDRAYYDTLEKESGHALEMDHVDIRRMDACALEFPDNHFNYVYSNAVFEHIKNIDKAFSEIARVLNTGGIANIGVHLFPSLSGGHNLEWAYPDEKLSISVPPWDHLRQNLYSAHAYLNRLREKDYLSVFNKYLSIIDISSKHEGEQFLTEEILKELPDFSRDELLKRSIRVVMKK